jgi:hypothetical protein
MAAPKGKEKLNKLFDEIIIDISEKGKSAITAMKDKMSTATFYKMLEDNEKLNKYEKAMQMRTDRMAEELLNIADSKETDGSSVQRDRLRVDARKWVLAKMNPRKYGDKLDVTTDNEPINKLSVEVIDNETRENLKKLSEND